jgi:hypothetical protein
MIGGGRAREWCPPPDVLIERDASTRSWHSPSRSANHPARWSFERVGGDPIHEVPSAARPGGRAQVQPLDVKAGDRILFGKWSGTEVKLDNVEYLIMKESDIMGIIEGRKGAKAA